MGQWVTFDAQSAAQLKERFGSHNVDLRPGGLSAAAFLSIKSCIMLLPGEHPGTVLLVHIEPSAETAPVSHASQISAAQPLPIPEPPSTEVARSQPQYAASGFLGLTDEAVFEPEELVIPESYGWWKQFKAAMEFTAKIQKKLRRTRISQP